MIEIRQTQSFVEWLYSLRDLRGRARILARIERLALGNPGDSSGVGGGVSELRIHSGPGYRVYYTYRGSTLIILLAGGDKSTQKVDIQLAIRTASQLET